jgi:hypothetical protein
MLFNPTWRTAGSVTSAIIATTITSQPGSAARTDACIPAIACAGATPATSAAHAAATTPAAHSSGRHRAAATSRARPSRRRAAVTRRTG